MKTPRHLDDKVLRSDYYFLDQNLIDRNSLDFLSELELITQEDAQNYYKAEDKLYYGLNAKFNADVIARDFNTMRVLAAGIIGATVGFFAGIGLSAVAANYGYSHIDLIPALCGIGTGLLSATGAALYSKIEGSKKYKVRIRSGSPEALEKAYEQHIFNLNNIWDKIKSNRSKAGEKGEAIQKIKSYVKLCLERLKK